MANPNDTETWRRRGGPERTMDAGDGVNNRDADKDYLGNLRKFSEHNEDAAGAPNRKSSKDMECK